MHMADALLSPAVGGTLWAASAATIAVCARRVGRDLDDRRIPLMGVLGAFIFAAQMINFTIPGTGSSGHLGGGLLLAVLLGPWAGFLTMASVLTVQALFFADGGLLALGCNIFNLGFFTCFLAYPLLFKPLAGRQPTPARLIVAALLAAVAGLQLGALSVVVETVVSGVSALSFTSFALLMQPIHLAIGIVEGVVTAAVITFIWKARPEVLETTRPLGAVSLRQVLLGLALAAALTGGFLSWFASSHPDGLEWALLQATGSETPALPQTGVHGTAAGVQQQTALLPDYNFKSDQGPGGRSGPDAAGTSVSGLAGGAITLALLGLVGWLLKRLRRRTVSAVAAGSEQ